MEIFQATMDDLEGVSGLFNLYRMFYERESDIDGARNYMKERIASKDSIIFVVKENEEYIGFCQLYPTYSSISMKRVWILNDLYVDREARKQGVGDLLLRKVKEYALETNAKGISLSTAIDNYSAQRLYQKHGYKQDSEFYQFELTL